MFFIRNMIGFLLIVFLFLGGIFAKPEINIDITKIYKYRLSS